jgi:hypothetical protein
MAGAMAAAFGAPLAAAQPDTSATARALAERALRACDSWLGNGDEGFAQRDVWTVDRFNSWERGSERRIVADTIEAYSEFGVLTIYAEETVFPTRVLRHCRVEARARQGVVASALLAGTLEAIGYTGQRDRETGDLLMERQVASGDIVLHLRTVTHPVEANSPDRDRPPVEDLSVNFSRVAAN